MVPQHRGVVMNLQPHDGFDASNTAAIPNELSAFCEPSFLLPGENRQQFEVIRNLMMEEVRPQTSIEWLWTLDLVELSWEILRYQRLKQRVLHAYRYDAIKAILLQLDGAGIPAQDLPNLKLQVGRSAAAWRDDPEAADEIEARLRRHGFDDGALNAEIFCQARSAFASFEKLLHAAQNRRMRLLREINSRRQAANARRSKTPS
jgi:hypothetical protein